jgi:hypothetical protein
MGLLDRKKLLTKQVLKIEKVDLENDDYVYVRQMTGRERDNYEQSLRRKIEGKNGVADYELALENFRAKLAVNTICDEKGNLILHLSDYEVLSDNMSAFTLEKIINAAQRLNNITEEDKEGLVKNSVAAQSGDSILDSARS